MGILNKTLDELSVDMENKVQKALAKIKENEERIQHLKGEIKSEANRLARMDLDEESKENSPAVIQKKIRRLRSQLTEAEELAEAYRNMKVIFSEKDRKKIKEAWEKEQQDYEKESKVLSDEHNRLREELKMLEQQEESLAMKIRSRITSGRPGLAKVESILQSLAQLDYQLASAVDYNRHHDSRGLITDWVNGNSLDKYIPDVKPTRSIGSVNDHGGIDYY